MRYYDNGYFYTVTFSPQDTAAFSRRWPWSTVRGSGSFTFADNGDLVDTTGIAERRNGTGWLTFCQDCRAFGSVERERRRIKSERHPLT